MSRYLLDTDILQLYQDGNSKVIDKIQSIAVGDRTISVITVEEQLSGWYSILRQAKDSGKLAWAYRRLAATVRFLARIEILDFDLAAIDRCDQLKKLKLKVRKMDLRIASIALQRGAVLVTRNTRDFRLIPKLQIEDWSK